MVQRIINILNKEFSSLHKAAYLLGLFALLSQILALARDRLLAGHFGAGVELDVYYAAFRIPDLLYVAIASFVSITVLIPFLAEKISDNDVDGGDDARKFLDLVFSCFLAVIISLSVIVFFFIPKLSFFIVPGFSDVAREQFVFITRILLLSPILLGVSSLLGSVTQTYRKFFVYASAPVLYNVGIILGIIFLLPKFGIVGVVFGVIFGAILHLLIQVPVVLRHGLMPKLTINWDFVQIKKVVFLSIPRTIALSVTHGALIVLIALASRMYDGSIAVFNFSFNLQSVPLAIIGVSYSVAAFPTLARLFAGNKRDEFVSQIAVAARHIIFWATPVIVLFIVLRAQIVRTILGSGEFDWSDTRLVAAALAIFAVSVLAQALQLLFVRAYYAAGETRTPVIVNTFSAILIVVFAFVFIKIFETFDTVRYFIESLLRINDVAGSSIVILPLAYSAGMIINCILLFVLFRKRFGVQATNFGRVFATSFSASVIMGFVAYEMLKLLDGVFDLDTFIGVFAQGFFAGITGIVAGIIVLVLLKNDEIKEVLDSIHNKVKRKQIIAPDTEELR